MDSLISRQAAIDVLTKLRIEKMQEGKDVSLVWECLDEVMRVQTAQTTLYGYKIEHLAYIARVMEKEGVTADYAVRTFDDMSRVIKMIIDEIQQKAEEALNGRIKTVPVL